MLSSGTVLDNRYEVLNILGTGGMSTVYLCKNMRLETLWAIKEVKKDMKNQLDFLAEPNILKKLDHPNIPRIIDIFYHDENLYIVEDYIEGENLQSMVERRGRLETNTITEIMLQLCDVIKYLHGLNPPIIYRDLKPSNIIITPNNKAVLIDFGISRVYKKEQYKDTIFMGSKGYAAPEQYGASQTDKRTDIYGLGATAYYMAVGKAPETLMHPLKDDGYDALVDINLRRIIMKSMQLEPEDRYSCVELLKGDIRKLTEMEYTDKTMLLSRDSTYEEADKTRFMNIEDEELDKTRMINADKNDAEHNNMPDMKIKKVKSRKKVIAASVIIMLLCIAAGAALLMHKKDTVKVSTEDLKTPIVDSNNSSKISDKPVVPNNESNKSNVNVNSSAKDINIQGVLNIQDNRYFQYSGDTSQGSSKGKGKGKQKLNEHAYNQNNYSASLSLNPSAQATIYNNKIKVTLSTADIKGQGLSFHGNIENHSTANTNVFYQGASFMSDEDKSDFFIKDWQDNGRITVKGSNNTDMNINFGRLNLKAGKIVFYFKAINNDNNNMDTLEITVNIV